MYLGFQQFDGGGKCIASKLLMCFWNHILMVGDGHLGHHTYSLVQLWVSSEIISKLQCMNVLIYLFHSPFHAAVGMLTTRMMLNVHKAANKTTFISGSEVELPTTTNLLPSAGGASGWNVAQNSQLTGASLRV